MFRFHWLSSLKDKLRAPISRNRRTYRKQNCRVQAPFVQASVSRFVTESLEDRTMLTSVISIDDVTVVEGDSGTTNAIFTVTRTGTNAGDLNSIATVDFTTQDGTATTADGDYSFLDGMLSFSADNSAVLQTQTISIQIHGDSLTEGNETFQLLLSNSSLDTTIQNNIGTVTISNDDANSISINDVTASENEEFIFEISLNQIAGSDITFLANTLTNTANNNDYTFLTNKQITIQAGELTTQVKVHVHDDDNQESDETFSLVLSELQFNGELAPSNVTIADNTGQGTILNDDGLPGSVFTIKGEKIAEGNDGTQFLRFTIIRTGGTAGDLNFATSVHFSTVNGTAIAGEDYTEKSETIHFSASPTATSQASSIVILIEGDPYKELSETLIGRLSNPTDGSVLKGNVTSLDAVGIITNDDSEFVFQNSFSADPIHANHTGDSVGNSVAIDGDVMVVGAPSNSLNGYNAGVAYVYARNQQGTPLDQTDDTWDYQTFLQPPIPGEDIFFAGSVAIYGDTIVISAERESTGAVYVFTRAGDDWKSEPPLVEQIRVESLYSMARFGTSVAIYENTIVVGALLDNSSGTHSGAAYIFEKVGNDWSTPSMRRLVQADPDFGDHFGESVSIHSEIIVISARFDDDNGIDSGAAYVYTKVSESWITAHPLVSKLTASNGMSGDYFGTSVATNGTEVVIGAQRTNSNGILSGSAYLYTRNGSDWISMPPNEIEFVGDDENDHFGTTVSINDNQIIVGAIFADEIGIYFGAVYVYAKSGADWNLHTVSKSVLTSEEGAVGYGRAVTISNNTIVIGATLATLDGWLSGGAYIYEMTNNNSWSLTTEINPTEISTIHNGADRFGQGIAVSEGYLVISAPGTDSTLAPTGVVYIYAKNDAGTPDFYDDDTWVYETSLADPSPEANREFGSSIAIEGTTIVVTADSSSFVVDSEVFVYTRNGSDWVSLSPTVTPLLANASRSLQGEISVAIQSNTIVVGNEGGSENVTQSGVVYVYEKNGTDWSTIVPTESILAASDGAQFDFFGTAVDIDDDKIIVGANGNENRGAAYLYQKGITGWNSATETKLIGSDLQTNGGFGNSVIIQNSIAFVASPPSRPRNSGAVYIFDGTESWDDPIETKITPGTHEPTFLFETKIDLYGNLLVINGNISVLGTETPNGSVYIYDGTDGWSNFEETIFTYPTYSELYQKGFGQSAVAIHQSNLLIAALRIAPNPESSLVYNYNRTSSAEVHLRVVDSPTSTQPNGEAATLPVNKNEVREWSPYWVEIWVNSNSSTDEGIFSTGLDLNYNTEFTTATEIEFSAGFTQNQTGTINDTTGTIEGLYAETSVSDLGTDSYLLFARIKFEPLAEDQVELNLPGKSIGPNSLNFAIGSEQVSLTGDIPVTNTLTKINRASIYANPYDLNDDDAINFRDLMLFASVYNTIPSESNSDYSWFADLNQSDRVNFKDLILFASNYGKRKSNQSMIVYPQNFPEAWNNLLIADTSQAEPQTSPVSLSQSAADSVLDGVVEYVSPQLTPSQNETLENIDIQVIDLEGDTLGRAVTGTIYIDVNAAGYGWFIDDTPGDHSEFEQSSHLSLIALPDSDAAGRVDLWSVIMHELGHLLGYEHEDEGVMEETLAPGIRKLPHFADEHTLQSDSETDEFFTSLKESSNLVAF